MVGWLLIEEASEIIVAARWRPLTPPSVRIVRGLPVQRIVEVDPRLRRLLPEVLRISRSGGGGGAHASRVRRCCAPRPAAPHARRIRAGGARTAGADRGPGQGVAVDALSVPPSFRPPGPGLVDQPPCTLRAGPGRPPCTLLAERQPRILHAGRPPCTLCAGRGLLHRAARCLWREAGPIVPDPEHPSDGRRRVAIQGHGWRGHGRRGRRPDREAGWRGSPGPCAQGVREPGAREAVARKPGGAGIQPSQSGPPELIVCLGRPHAEG